MKNKRRIVITNRSETLTVIITITAKDPEANIWAQEG